MYVKDDLNTIIFILYLSKYKGKKNNLKFLNFKKANNILKKCK